MTFNAKPVAWIEHHKGGDNLVWDKTGLQCTPLFKADALESHSCTEQVNFIPITIAEKTLQAGMDWSNCPVGTFSLVLGILRAYAVPVSCAEAIRWAVEECAKAQPTYTEKNIRFLSGFLVERWEKEHAEVIAIAGKEKP